MPGSGYLADRFDASQAISPVYVAVSTFVQGSLPEGWRGSPVATRRWGSRPWRGVFNGHPGDCYGSRMTLIAPVERFAAVVNASAAASSGNRWVISASGNSGVVASRAAAPSTSRPAACRP